MNWILILLALPFGLLIAYGIYHRRVLGEGPAFREYWSSSMQVKVERVRVRKLPYGADRQQYLLFCEPTGGATRREVIFHIHGGGWRYGRPDYFLPQAQVLCDAGFAVVMVCHRKAPRHKVGEQRQDIIDAYRTACTLLDELETYRAAPFIGFGISSGGNHLGLLAYDRERAQAENIDLDRISALALFGAPLDLRGMKWSTVLRSYAGSRRATSYATANPATYLDARSPALPIFAVHGTADAIVPFTAGDPFYQKIETLFPGTLQLIVVEGGRHLSPVSWTYEADGLRERMLGWLEGFDMV